MPTVHLLDYVAGNVRSLTNAIEKLGFTVSFVKKPSEIDQAEVNPNFPLCCPGSIDLASVSSY